MNIQLWLKYFHNLYEKEGINTVWKFENSSKNFKGQTLKIYIYECLDCTTYDKIADFLTGKFISINITLFSEFSAQKLFSQESRN